jgi:hypothetical protein
VEDVGFILGTLAAAGAAIFVYYAVAAHHRRAADLAWRQLADEFDGSLTTGSSLWSGESTALRATVDGREITVTEKWIGAGRGKQLCTGVTAVAWSQHLALQMRRSWWRWSWDTPPGLRAFATGDEAFDRLFSIRTNDEPLARYWLGPATRAALLATEGYSFTVSEGSAWGLRAGFDDKASRVKAAMRAVAALSRGGAALLDSIEGLLGGLGPTFTHERVPSGGSLGGAEIALDLGGSQMRCDALTREAGVLAVETQLWTRVRALATAHDAPFVVIARDAPRDTVEVIGLRSLLTGDADFDARFALWGPAPALDPDRFPPALRRHIVAVSPTALAADGVEVTALLAGLVTDRDRLLGTLDLVAGLAGSRVSGPYR